MTSTNKNLVAANELLIASLKAMAPTLQKADDALRNSVPISSDTASVQRHHNARLALNDAKELVVSVLPSHVRGDSKAIALLVNNARRWDFLMTIADNPAGPEAAAFESHDAAFESDRPKSLQITETVDAAIATKP